MQSRDSRYLLNQLTSPVVYLLILLFFFLSLAACESAVTLLFDAVMHLGCKPYLDSQRESCVCQYELMREL